MFLSEQLVTAVVLFSLAGGYALDAVAGLLNLKHRPRALPDELSDIYDPAGYEKSGRYLKANTLLSLLSQGVFMGVVLTFWFNHGFGMLDAWIRQTGLDATLQGLLFIGMLALARGLVSLPFSLYATFAIEERFGFNTTTPALFLKDLVKSVCLGLLLGSPILAVVLWLLESLGPGAWLPCWGALLVFILAAQYVIPTWIMPLFNRFTPLGDGPLKDAVFSYARSIDFPLAQILVMDGSRRSSKSNAFFTGFGKARRIVLLDTLVTRHDTEELVSVLAHEMGHYKKRHILKRLAWTATYTGVMFFLLSRCISSQALFSAFYVDHISAYAGLVFFSLLFTPADMLVSLLMNHSSRKDEYEADRFAARTLACAAPLVTALKKLSVHNLSNPVPHPFYVVLNYSHPPLLERLRALVPYLNPQNQAGDTKVEKS